MSGARSPVASPARRLWAPTLPPAPRIARASPKVGRNQCRLSVMPQISTNFVELLRGPSDRAGRAGLSHFTELTLVASRPPNARACRRPDLEAAEDGPGRGRRRSWSSRPRLRPRRRAPPEGGGLHRQRLGERAGDRAAARRARLRRQPRRSSCVVRGPDGGRLDVRRPGGPPRGRPAQRASCATTEHVGRVVNPLRDRREGRGAARSRRPFAGARRPPVDAGHRGRGRRSRPRTAKARLDAEHARRAHGRLRARLQRGQRPDARGPDQGRADRLPDPRGAAAARLPRRGRGGDPAAASA